MKSNITLIAYFILLFIEIWARYTNNNFIELLVKPLLMPVLALWFWQNIKKIGKAEWIMMAALFFSWLGDIFLLNQVNIFIAGLGSFLIAHICYIIAFKKPFKNQIKTKLLIGLPLIALAIGILYLLYPTLNDMLVPVIVYTSIITLMSLFALNRLGFVNNKSFGFVLIGALTFMASDSMIAFNKFYNAFDLAGTLIMLTYGLAQYFIVKGILLEK